MKNEIIRYRGNAQAKVVKVVLSEGVTLRKDFCAYINAEGYVGCDDITIGVHFYNSLDKTHGFTANLSSMDGQMVDPSWLAQLLQEKLVDIHSFMFPYPDEENYNNDWFAEVIAIIIARKCLVAVVREGIGLRVKIDINGLELSQFVQTKDAYRVFIFKE
jgi:hypothetical protein